MSKDFQIRNFDFLDAYRGLAALSVVCQHAGEHTEKRIFNGGWFGVPAFFQLSAFLLTYRMILQYEQGREHGIVKQINITFKYFVMRFCRIYLTYLAFCVIELALENIFFRRGHDYELGTRMYHLIFLKTDYMRDEPVGPLWTLPIEVLFCFLFCFFLLLLLLLNLY